MSRLFPVKTISDEEFFEGIALAWASFYRWKGMTDDMYFMQKPISYWMNKLEKGERTVEVKLWAKTFVEEILATKTKTDSKNNTEEN